MVKEFPAFHCDKDAINPSDIVMKMKVLEDSMNGFMRQNAEQMKVLTDTVAKVHETNRSNAPRITVDTPWTSAEMNSETPGSKKRKVNDDENEQNVVGITPISASFA